MSSCTKSNEGTAPDGLAEICLSSGSIESRAVSGDGIKDGKGDIVGLQFLRIDAPSQPANFGGLTNSVITGKRTGNATPTTASAITFDNKQHYSATAANHSYFVSYFPAGSMNSNVVTWDIDGATDILTSNVIDAGTNASHGAIPALNYRHELAQIAVICMAENGKQTQVNTRWGDIKRITLKGTRAQMQYSYATLATTAFGGLKDINLLKGETYKEEFAPVAIPAFGSTAVIACGMFMPSASQNFALEVDTANEGVKSLTINLGNGEQLARAKRHLVTLTFKESNTSEAEILITSTVEQWSNGASGSGSFN